MQNFQRTYQYINDYLKLVYDYYSKVSTAFLVTYYNLDTTSTIWDNTYLLGGSYERVGDLSGVRWKRYLLLPVYFPEEIVTAFDGREEGYIKENESHIVIPSTYGITPYPRDIIFLDHSFLRQKNNIYPIFVVCGVEKSSNTDVCFYRLKIENEQSRTINDIDLQVEETYVFFEYDKKIHTVEDTEKMIKIMKNCEKCSSRLKKMFDHNSGFFLI